MVVDSILYIIFLRLYNDVQFSFESEQQFCHFFPSGRVKLSSKVCLQTMDRVDSYRKHVALLWRAFNILECYKEDHPCKIEEGLYLGSIGAANNKDALKNLNVTHILTVASSLPPAHLNDFVYKVIDVADREDINISRYFDECLAFIDEAKKNCGGVLVHCFAGRSRSVTIVIAYLMKKCGMGFSEALEYVKSKRPQAAPNAGFISQLKDMENSLQVTAN